MLINRHFLAAVTSLYSTKQAKLVLGCGSNLVDQFFIVQGLGHRTGNDILITSVWVGSATWRVIANPEIKGPNKIYEKSIVGGVTLNHLSWASVLGVPTGLLGLQGDDPSGHLIKKTMRNLKVSDQFVTVNKDFTTGESFVFVQEDGERSIVMASGATSLIDEEIANRYFEKAILNDCEMLTTEICQVPLSGVLAVLRTAKEAGITTVLDLDVSPSVATNEARLGSIEELKEFVT